METQTQERDISLKEFIKARLTVDQYENIDGILRVTKTKAKRLINGTDADLMPFQITAIADACNCSTDTIHDIIKKEARDVR